MIIKYTTGFAGTGKSTLLIKHLKTLVPEQTIVLAPTHKALGVLEDKLEGALYMLSTIHSALGWIPGVNEDADNAHQVDITRKLDKDFEGGVTNIIIDEFSMMSEDMLYDLTSKIDEFTDYESDHITLTLYGDPYQLPPVKATPIQIDPAETTNLTTQHRSKSKDIPQLFKKFIDYIDGTNTKDLSIPESENVHYVSDFKGFKRGDRVLAYTNQCVGALNIQIAKQEGIHGYEGVEVQLGNLPDTVIVDKIYTSMDAETLAELYTTEKLKLQNAQINMKYFDFAMEQLADDEDITFVLGTDGLTYATIKGIGYANQLRKRVKEEAANAAKGSRERSRAWGRYYTINRAFTMDYTFASTVHKAQGSEFNTVWIHKADLLKIIGPTRNYTQYARMLYVAISRSISTLKVFS